MGYIGWRGVWGGVWGRGMDGWVGSGLAEMCICIWNIYLHRREKSHN